MTDIPLFQLYPQLQSAIPRIALGCWPTPVHSYPALAHAEHIAEFVIKHDDVSGELYGGNKVRKLELLLAAAVDRGCHAVLTFGGYGSNHALATSLYAHQQKLKCAAVLTPEPVTTAVRNTLRWHALLGTEIAIARGYADVSATGAQLQAEMGGADCYEIPFGGSSALGTLGFVNAALELAAQIDRGELAPPDIVYLACGTAGSAAGLALGLQLAGLPAKIEAVQVTPASLKPAATITRLCRQAHALLREQVPGIPALEDPFTKLRLRTDQLGAGYAQPTPAAAIAAKWLHSHTGLPVSMTYTAKACAALLADAHTGQLHDKRVLFWNTYNSISQPPEVDTADWCQLPAELHSCFRSS